MKWTRDLLLRLSLSPISENYNKMTPPGCCKSYTDTTPSLSDFQENIREFRYNTDKAVTTIANGNKLPSL